MTSEEFEQLVNAGIKAVPKRFLDLLDNVAFVIEEFPTREQARKLKLKHKWALFGLYEGVPLTKRGNPHLVTLPDKITIFRQPIEQVAGNPAAIKDIVTNTVWHEIAHHFGMDHDQIRKAEQKKSSK